LKVVGSWPGEHLEEDLSVREKNSANTLRKNAAGSPEGTVEQG
jgi:hypothetical protein